MVLDQLPFFEFFFSELNFPEKDEGVLKRETITNDFEAYF